MNKKKNNLIAVNFLKQVVGDWRYWMLLALLLVMNFIGPTIPLRDKIDSSLQNKISPEIASTGSSYKLSQALDSRKGDEYHLLFQLKASNDVYVDSGSANKNNLEEGVQVSLADSLGNTKKIYDLVVPVNNDSFLNEDFFVSADGQYNSVVFQKKDASSKSEIFIKNFHLVRLFGDSKNIKPSFMGYFDNSIEMQNFNIIDAKSAIANLNKKNTLVGETFVAKTNYLTGVNLKLHFRGSGGNPDYRLVVKEIKDEKISENDLAQFNFNVYSAASLTKADTSNEVYFFPITAKLVSGRKYVIAIENDDVQTNLLNNLQVFGSSDAGIDSVDNFISATDNKIKLQTGSMYVKYYFATQPEYNSAEANFGSTFDDLGNGIGVFTYSKEDFYSDLDIFASSDNYTTYKINTFYPFNLFYVNAGISLGGLNSDYGVSYSFDNKHWTKINESQQENSIGEFTAQIKGENESNVIYIKATGHTNGGTSFGFNSLDMRANVNVK